MPDNDIRCPDRVRLEERAVEALREVLRVRGERKASLDRAMREGILASLNAARRSQREAQYALRAHIESHGC